jgi:diguanylate cyclase (GGDEF)-like protein
MTAIGFREDEHHFNQVAHERFPIIQTLLKRPYADALFLVALVLSGFLSRYFTLKDGLFTPMYLPAGLMLWWFIEKRFAGLTTALVARTISDRLVYPSSWNNPWRTILMGCIIVVAYCIGGWAVVQRAHRFERVHHVGWFMAVGCVITPAVTGFFVSVVEIANGTQIERAIAGGRALFVGDAIACAIAVPLLLRLSGKWAPDEKAYRIEREPTADRLDAIVQAVAIVVVPLAAFAFQSTTVNENVGATRAWLVLAVLPCLWVGLRGSSFLAQIASFLTVLILAIIARRQLGQTQDLVQIGAIMLAGSFATLYSIAVVRSQRRRTIEVRRATDERQRRDRTDIGTGLANRSGIIETLTSASLIGAGTGKVAVAAIGIDRFAELTDSIGYDDSERLAKEVGERLAGSDAHAVINVGRLDQGHFVVVSSVNNAAHAYDLGTTIVTAVARQPFLADADGLRIPVNVRVGVAFADDLSHSPTELLRNADIALRRAHSTEGNNIAVFNPEWRLEAEQHGELLAGLRDTLDGESGEFFLAYQAIENLSTGRIAAAEALVRWRNAEGVVVAPNDFIPLAERAGLINEIGDLVFRMAARQVREWGPLIANLPSFSVHVNVSPQQLADPYLAQKLQQHCAHEHIPTSRICLELTETDLSTDPAQAMQVLKNLRDAGFRVALDDFGTGFSTISWLSRFPIDTLKIDRTFVSGLPGKADDVAIVKLVIQLANELHLDVTAEGIETEDQRSMLEQFGCGTGQGFLFCRPIPPAELQARLEVLGA